MARSAAALKTAAPETGPNISADRLRSLVERIDRLQE